MPNTIPVSVKYAFTNEQYAKLLSIVRAKKLLDETDPLNPRVVKTIDVFPNAPRLPFMHSVSVAGIAS